MKAPVKAMIFDVGNVLLRWDVRALYRRILPDEAAIDAFLDETGLLAANVEFDRGLPFAEGLAALATAHPHHAQALAAFDDRWSETLVGPVPGTAEILDDLRAAGVACHGLTNFSAEKWPVAKARFPFLSRFDSVVVSGEEGEIKPDPAIWRILLDRTGLAPTDCVFADDMPDNIEAARTLGVDAILFTDAPALRRALETRGMLARSGTATPDR